MKQPFVEDCESNPSHERNEGTFIPVYINGAAYRLI